MADKDSLKERGRGLEEEYFRTEDAKLLAKLREKARLDELAEALAVKLQVTDPDLLRRIIALGVTHETGAAFLMAPAVQVAWAEGAVSDRERETLLRLARERGVEAGSPAHAQLQEWLRVRPMDQLFDAALEAIKTGLSVLPPAEHADRVKQIVEACRQVAAASGGGLFRVLGLGTGASVEEESLLDSIAAKLRAKS